jgi:transposase-like protein
MAAALRDAALRQIGQDSLIIAQLSESGGRRKSHKAQVVCPVPLTVQQRRALEAEAMRREVATSRLMLDALCAELGVKLPKTRKMGKRKMKGWQQGRRKSTVPSYSDKEKAEIVQYSYEHSMPAAAEKHGVSPATVYTWRQALPAFTPAEKARIVRYADKHGNAAAAEQFGVNGKTIGSWRRSSSRTK